MEISSEIHGEVTAAAQLQTTWPQTAAPASLTSPPADSVTVSQDARLLMEASRTAQTSPDVRRERVEALRIQVQNGTYRPDSHLIAQNLIREEPGLFAL